LTGRRRNWFESRTRTTALHALPEGADEEAVLMLSDILPTAFECGVLNGAVKPGDTVAIIGAGPIGLATLITAQLYSPASIVVGDVDAGRLEVARELGATHVVNAGDRGGAAEIMRLTEGRGADVAIEAVGLPETFDVCQRIVAPGGHIANIGVHGKGAMLHLDKLWDRNVTIATQLVDTVSTPKLLAAVLNGTLRPGRLITHRFGLSEITEAYGVFGRAVRERAIKVVMCAESRPASAHTAYEKILVR
jgi:alcohol dehydrogenase